MVNIDDYIWFMELLCLVYRIFIDYRQVYVITKSMNSADGSEFQNKHAMSNKMTLTYGLFNATCRIRLSQTY